MKNGTYIWLYRKFKNWEWYKDHATKSLFIHLLIMAEWRDVRTGGVEIKRGQVVTTESRLCDELNLTRQQIRTALAHLIETKEITKTSTSKQTVITIENYTSYQPNTVGYSQANNQESNQESNQQNNQLSTNQQPSANQPTIIYKKDYKDYNNARAREGEVIHKEDKEDLNDIQWLMSLSPEERRREIMIRAAQAEKEW